MDENGPSFETNAINRPRGGVQLEYKTPAPFSGFSLAEGKLDWPSRGMIWRIIVYSGLFIAIIAVLLPSRISKKPYPTRIACAANIHQLLGACWDYAALHHCAFPPNLAAVEAHVKNQNFARLVVCPATSTPYIYLGSGLATDAPGNTILIYEPPSNHTDAKTGKPSINFGFANGSVISIAQPMADKILAEINAGHNPPRAEMMR